MSGGNDHALTSLDLPTLKRGDIVLVRHKNSFFRIFLRRYMQSYWDHTALVLYPPEKRRGREKAIIAESIRTGLPGLFATRGVAIHQLDRYLSKPHEFDIGIKRVHDLSDDQRILATHMMMMNVDSPYWPWKMFHIVIAAIFPFLKRYFFHQQRFSCSSIIQKAFYDTLSWNEKDKVVFKEGVWSPIELQELVTPGDIAHSKITDWIYNEHV